MEEWIGEINLKYLPGVQQEANAMNPIHTTAYCRATPKILKKETQAP